MRNPLPLKGSRCGGLALRKIGEVEFGYFVKTDWFFHLFLPFYISKFFTAEEKNEFKNFKNRKRKIQFISGRIAAKLCLAEYLRVKGEEVNYREIEIKKEKRGKVYGSFNDRKIPVSIAHTEGISVAVSGNYKGIGVDVEKEDRNIERIADKFLTDEEEAFKNIPLIVLWSVKEAVSKAIGTGFIYSPKNIFICWSDGKKFKLKLKGKFLSLLPEFENKEIEVEIFRKGNFIFAICLFD